MDLIELRRALNFCNKNFLGSVILVNGLFCQRTIGEMDFSEKGHLGNGTFSEWERPFQKRTFGKQAFSEKDLK